MSNIFVNDERNRSRRRYSQQTGQKSFVKSCNAFVPKNTILWLK